MELIWTEEHYATGFEEIDAQHRDFILWVNNLLAMEDPHHPEVGLTLSFLANYVVRHFVCEERLMDAHCCGGCRRNKLEHRAFVHHFDKLRADFGTERWDATRLRRLQRFLFSWIQNHFRKVDMKLREVAPQRTLPANR